MPETLVAYRRKAAPDLRGLDLGRAKPRPGRRPALGPEQVADVLWRRRAGVSIADIARRHRVDEATIRRALARPASPSVREAEARAERRHALAAYREGVARRIVDARAKKEGVAVPPGLDSAAAAAWLAHHLGTRGVAEGKAATDGDPRLAWPAAAACRSYLEEWRAKGVARG